MEHANRTIEMADVPAGVLEPVSTGDDAKRWIYELVRGGMSFHFDDDPHGMTFAGGVDSWTEEVADMLGNQVDAVWDLYRNGDCPEPHGHALHCHRWLYGNEGMYPFWQLGEDYELEEKKPLWTCVYLDKHLAILMGPCVPWGKYVPPMFTAGFRIAQRYADPDAIDRWQWLSCPHASVDAALEDFKASYPRTWIDERSKWGGPAASDAP